MVILVDSREPCRHPWQRYLPPGWTMERTALETGDLGLATHPVGAIVERKTPGDLASCIGSGRERFERELQRGRMSDAWSSWSKGRSLTSWSPPEEFTITP